MSNSGEDFGREDRIPHRATQGNAGLAASADNYHLSFHETSSARQLPAYRPSNDSNHHRLSSSYDANHSHDYLPSSYERGDRNGYHQNSIYNVNNQCLPPLPPSPNHYIIDSEEPFIPPPDSYLSPPGPAPPDRFQSSEAKAADRFLHADPDFYLSSASTLDRHDRSNVEQMYHNYSATTNKYRNAPWSESGLERYSNYYQTLPYSDSSRHSYQRRELDYLNYCPTLNSSHYHQKSGFSLPPNKRVPLYNQCQNVRFQKCCDTPLASSRDTAQTYDLLSSRTRARIRSKRISSPPVSLLTSAVAATVPVDFTNSSMNNGRYLSSFSSTLSRCSSFSGVDTNPTAIESFRKVSAGHENCCYKRHTSSPSSVANPFHSSNYSTAMTTAPASSTMSTSSSTYFQQPLTSLTSTWKSVTVNPNTTSLLSSHLQNNAPSLPEGSLSTSSSCNSNVNSPSLSFSSSRSSPLLTTMNTTNTTVSATTSPTAISSNSSNSGVSMEHHRQQVQRTTTTAASEFDEETTSPSTEMADDSVSSINESLTSPPHRSTSPAPSCVLRNPPASLPLQAIFERRNVKIPLQHQISAPVTAMEMASSKRYRRSTSKKELIKNYIKKETAVFFGVHEPSEENERARWLDRRKRLAYRTYGKLKNEYQLPSASSTLQKPDVLPLSSQKRSRGAEAADERDAAEPRSVESTLKRKPSVARMTINGVAYVVSTLGRHKRRSSSASRQWSRSYVPSSVPPTPSSPLDDEVFFDKSYSNSDECRTRSLGTTIAFNSDFSYEPTTVCHSDEVDSSPYVQSRYSFSSQRMRKEKSHTWRRTSQRIEKNKDSQNALTRLWNCFFDSVFDNSDRRQYGMGVVGRMFGRSLKRSVMSREPVKEQLEDLEDHRPFFTYWVTTVQILILALSVFAYGLGPVGFDLTQRSGLVLVTSLSLQQVEYSEPSNFWIGPRAADLIHMGAKFAPCMRKDKKIIKEIEKMRDRERETACCIRNDDSGCVQASQAECSKTISTWKKWPGESGPGGRLSGSVCGLDPKFCEAPASVAPYEWPDDITKWPICRKTNSRFPVQMSPSDNHRYQKDKMTAEHMVCEVIGHPCCIGIHGTCRITTKEYCDFVHGYFHEDASLCSQVSCLDDVCGMIPFYFPEVPDQFYRLWTSLFIHAGILHLAITVFIQYFLMRDLEKLTGAVRIGFIYVGSGVAGNLASAIFVPYRADVGPAGSQFGLLACLIVEVLNCWPMLKHPFQALCKLLVITFCLFLFGLLPWVDNFAHLFGFVFGFLLSYALLPFVSFGPYDRQKKIFLIWVCLMSSLFLFVLLVLLFYLIPIYDCEICHYFNCIPLTRDFCATQNINFKREEYVV